MKCFVKVLSIFMCLCLVTGLFAACGKTETKPDNAAAPTAAPTGAAAKPDAAKAPVKIKILMNLPPEYPVDNNKIVEEIEKKANVKLEIINPPMNNFTEKRNIMLASGELPDVVMFDGIADKQYRSGIEQGIFVDLKKYLEKAENIMKYTDKTALQYVTNEDGKIMAIPRASLNRGDGFLVRQDWLDKLGIKQHPTTIDGFYEMMKAFAKNDPDGNGKADTYAITADNGDYGWMGKLLPAFGTGYGWQEDASGNIYQTKYRGDGYKEGLKFAARLMKEGIVDPEILVNKTAREKFYNGTIGLRNEYVGWLPRDRDSLKKVVPTADVKYLHPPVNKEGKLVSMNSTLTGVWWIYAVTTAAKDPQGIVNFFNWCLSDDGWNILVNGVEGIHYTARDGKKEFTPEFDKYNTWRNYFAFLRRPDIDFYVSKALKPEDQTYVSEVLKKCSEIYLMEKHLGHRTAAEDELAKGDWDKKEKEIINKIVYGELSADAWDQFVKEFRAAGFDKVEKEMNEWYQKAVKGKK